MPRVLGQKKIENKDKIENFKTLLSDLFQIFADLTYHIYISYNSASEDLTLI